MRFILRKFVDANTAKEALDKDAITPVHDVYLKDGESPKSEELRSCIGFIHPDEPSYGFIGEPQCRKKQ